jgi:hypothetical protein
MSKPGYQTGWIAFVLVMATSFSGCQKEVVPDPPSEETESGGLRLDGVEGFLDLTTHTLMFTLPADTVSAYSAYVQYYDYEALWFNGTALIHGQQNQLGEVAVSERYPLITVGESLSDTLYVVFTKLPLMRIDVTTGIQDEPKALCSIVIQSCDEGVSMDGSTLFESVAGIEIRGKSSTSYEKKSYGLELWEDESANDYIASLLGMRPSEDWILDAMYVDRSRMRNKLSFDLWERLANIPSASPEESIDPGVMSRYVELFINDSYEGVYNLSEKLDAHLLQFNKYQYEMGGVIYKAIDWGNGSTTFETCCTPLPEEFIWEGWEQIYPGEMTMWGPLDSLRNLVVSSGDAEFREKITGMIDLNNLADYYLYINLLMAWDNAGKNTFLVRHSAHRPFFILPWDVEASWGRMWDGTDSKYYGLVANHLFNRVIETNAGNFNELLEEKWEEFRSDGSGVSELLDQATSYCSRLAENGTMERENERWDLDIDIYAEHRYLSDWFEARVEYLDHYFD